VALRGLLASALVLALTISALAVPRTKTRFDGIRDCERTGAIQFMRHNAQFKRFIIDRANVDVDRYADQVANRFIATIYHGRATYEAAGGPRSARFICLHGGIGRGAVFVYTLPD
jgi:hypothetical protein